MGNDSNKMWWQITKEKLDKLGWEGELDLTKVGQLVNKPCRLSYSTKDKDGNPLKNGPRWNFTFRTIEEIDGASANAMLAQMMGGCFTAPAAGVFNAPAPSAAPAAPTAPNPFAGM